MLAAGKSEAEVFQALRISSATWDRWKKQFGGMKCDEAKRLRELEIENQRLKKELLAEAELDKEDPEDGRRGKLLSPTRRREAVLEHKRPSTSRSVGHAEPLSNRGARSGTR